MKALQIKILQDDDQIPQEEKKQPNDEQMDVEVDKRSSSGNNPNDDEQRSLAEKDDLQKPASPNVVPQMDPPKRISEIKLRTDASNKSKEMPKASEEYQRKNILASSSNNKMIDHIPCLYLPYDDGSNKLILYFHGNAEDVGLAFDMLFLIGQRLQMHVLAVEYPGYGLYKNQKPDENIIKEDAVIIYDYLTTVVGLLESDIILFGRSMGSGPSTYLSSIRKPHALLLMSGYTSIQNAAKSILGWASILGFIIYEKFRNIDVIKETTCPVLLIHGKKDALIPVQHAIDLYNNCNQPCYLHMPAKMDHNEFLIDEDLVQPIRAFLRKIEERNNLKRKVMASYASEAPSDNIYSSIARNLKGFGHYLSLE